MKNSLLKLWQRWWFLSLATLISVGICLNAYIGIHLPLEKPSVNFQTTSVYTAKSHQFSTLKPIPSQNPQPTSSPKNIPINSAPSLGHFPYQEGNFSKMLFVGSYGQREYQRFERLMPEAAFALMKLTNAARDEGVWIIPVSCFRNSEDQRKLFTAQIQRRGSREAAAKSSAPPGYSEHHTGYALDLADGHSPQQDVSLEFAKTEAFKWMNLRAKEFGFELSFPENNSQGVNYEPWHWRFVGTAESSEVFRHLH
ncbi:M15 family metallopeptidase [Trichocoleus sp. FACHB-591]|uniref:M15 family metallopeptidase n=1 Tax=Trichocoleus sp. FACHB-591 TaxID=2692872 RepID=UPI0016853609|nr:M15 family metallopeptidase [Trichocoleus sp. FACHB-591]MBD2096804.1 M15 family metallopeptidase [Trichocoleus sp. FACHB-591]